MIRYLGRVLRSGALLELFAQENLLREPELGNVEFAVPKKTPSKKRKRTPVKSAVKEVCLLAHALF